MNICATTIEKCFYCGTEIATNLNENPYALKKHRDHYQPKSQNGDDGPLNIVPACIDCNLRKKAMEPGEWRSRCFVDAFMAIRRLRWLIGTVPVDRLDDIIEWHRSHSPSLGLPTWGGRSE